VERNTKLHKLPYTSCVQAMYVSVRIKPVYSSHTSQRYVLATVFHFPDALPI